MKKNVRFIPDDILFGRTMKDMVDLCLTSDFPGTKKWPADHPIWDCNIARCVTPRSAWSNPEVLTKAVYNMFWIVQKSIRDNKYDDFVEAHKQAVIEGGIVLLRKVLARFTIAKIAPKVTALPESLFLRDVLETGTDLSNGVYCPMAGFGGIVRGCETWFAKNKLSTNIEAFDINQNLCNYYGWSCRDVLSEKVVTDKVVVVCPPFGNNTEQWAGTDSKFLLDMEDWCLLIKEYITAPRYIFFGPNKWLNSETDRKRFRSGVMPNGLFRHKIQATCLPYYEQYSMPGFSTAELTRLTTIKSQNPWIISDYF